MNNYKLEIIPGVLEKDWSEIEAKLEKIKTFAKSAHIDFIDGKFVDNLTFLDPKPFSKHKDTIFLEAHLMVENPIELLKPLFANGFKRVIGHVEKMGDIPEFVAQGQILGEVGLALDGPTELDALKDIKLDDLDCLLVYTSEKVGFAGPPMMDERLEKIKNLREKTLIPIEADGGVKDNTIEKALDAGATRFVATSFLWENENPKDAYNSLLAKINDHRLS